MQLIDKAWYLVSGGGGGGGIGIFGFAVLVIF